LPKFKPYFELSIPSNYSPDERRAIAAEIIDYVVSRTEKGIDAFGEKFAKYSPSYAKEKGQKNVDLTFSGDMLSEIKLLQEKPGKIRIGYSKDYKDIPKVEGNVLSTYGQDKPVTKPRNFLGITEKEVKRILSRYPVQDKEERKDRVAEVKAADIVSKDILGSVGFFDEGE